MLVIFSIRVKSSKFVLAFSDYFSNYFHYVFTCMDEFLDCFRLRMVKGGETSKFKIFGELTIFEESTASEKMITFQPL